MRGRMDDRKSYAKQLDIGDVMTGESVCEVIASNRQGYAAGDIVLAPTGWRTHAAIEGSVPMRKLDPKLAPISTGLGVLGMPGFTAYAGLSIIGKPKQGETVVVAAASGPVGSLVGQLAKLGGARAVGIAGGRKSATTFSTSYASTPPLITALRISLNSWQVHARKGSTFISKMWAARFGRLYCRFSILSPVCRSAG